MNNLGEKIRYTYFFKEINEKVLSSRKKITFCVTLKTSV